MSNEIVTTTAPAPVSVLAPTNFKDAFAFAEAAAASGMFGVKTPQQAFVIVARAAELGIGPATALSSMHVINGRPTMSADLQVGLCKARKDICKYFYCVESTDTTCTWETHRIGDPQPSRMTFTFAEAERAGLTAKADSNWKKYPKQMLKKRTAAFLARDVYPDIIAGIYETDEARDIELADSARQRPAQASPRPAEVVVLPAQAIPEDDEERALKRRLEGAKTQAEFDVVRRELSALKLPAGVKRDRLVKAMTANQERLNAKVIDVQAEPVEQSEGGQG